jgi:hypothetical protein
MSKIYYREKKIQTGTANPDSQKNIKRIDRLTTLNFLGGGNNKAGSSPEYNVLSAT